MQAILVEREPAFAKYYLDLGSPEAIDMLLIQKTVQFPENAINANESQNDGNWKVLKCLLDQVSKLMQVNFSNMLQYQWGYGGTKCPNSHRYILNKAAL